MISLYDVVTNVHRHHSIHTGPVPSFPPPPYFHRGRAADSLNLSLSTAGEFEAHAGCWMGWPDSGYLWRDGSKPAQEQYANIAKAISQFEPLTMFANKGPVCLPTENIPTGSNNHV